MDFSDATNIDVETARQSIRHDAWRSLVLGFLGITVAAGGYLYDSNSAPAEKLSSNDQVAQIES
jgi:hypothetical protein